MATPDGRTFNFVVELDNGTERVRSRRDVESIERKLRGYDAHQAQFEALDPQRYLVLFVTTRSQQRLQHILDVATLVMQNQQRTVFIGTDLKSFLEDDPFETAMFAESSRTETNLAAQIQTFVEFKSDFSSKFLLEFL